MITPQESIRILLAHGLTQEQIARIAHIKQPTVSRLLNDPKRATSFLISDALREAVKKVQGKSNVGD